MAAEKYNIIALPPKALLFDVFGTVVNWRASLTAMLATTAATRLQNGNLSSEMRDHIATFDDQTWGQFAENWRDSYLEFAHNFKPETQQFRNVDYHWRQSLQELFIRYKLEGFFTDTETENLVNCWHSLEPWLDSSVGLQMLGSKMITCTLSDGPRAVLRDLDTFGNLHFREFLSSEDFQAYKPHPSVYLGAAKRLGLEPHECCMVAAHLRDLDGFNISGADMAFTNVELGARKCGFRTMFVERPQEEQWSPEEKRYQEAKSDWVDMWISIDEPGFIAAAEKFGISRPFA